MTREITLPAHAGSSTADRFRRAEAALWTHHGLAPVDRTLTLARFGTRLRVREVGSGDPVVLIHGTVGPGSWPSLIEAMPDHRFIAIDRPGWGGSDPLDYRGVDYQAVATDVLRDLFDALGIERATVAGASIGDVWALAMARRLPARVDRVVLLGGGPIDPDIERPKFIRLLASPIGRLIVRLPMTADRTRAILRDNGHGSSLDAGRIPDEFVAWRVAVSNHTPAMRHERAMIRAVVAGRGWSPKLLFDSEELASIPAPTLIVFGSADPTGSVPLWARFANSLPDGELEVIDGAGHMPWFDEPRLVADRIERFMDA